MASNFTFRFKSILNLKEKLEDEQKNQYGLAIRKLEEEKEHLHLIMKKKEQYEEEWEEKSRSIMKVKELQHRSIYGQHIQRLINKQNEIIKYCEEDVQQQRIKLLDITKEKKAFEKLKEKDYEAYQQELNLAEAVFLDQYVSYKSTVK